MRRAYVYMTLLFTLTGCLEEKWIGLVYKEGSDIPYHIGTFRNLEECISISSDRASELGEKYSHACLRDCNYNYDLGWDVCAEDAE